MGVSWKILVASSDVEIGQSIVGTLARLGVDTFSAANIRECKDVLEKQPVGLIFCGSQFRDGSYKDVLALIHSHPGIRLPRVVLVTAYIDLAEYQEARQLGVFDIISSPYRPITIEWIVIQAIRDSRKIGDRPSVITTTNTAQSAEAPHTQAPLRIPK